MRKSTTKADCWQDRPLCCSYLLVLFDTVEIGIENVGVSACARELVWATGLLTDGQDEVLGAWPGPLSSAPRSRNVFEDLKIRGVERIRFVASSKSAAVPPSVLPAGCLGATVLPAGWAYETHALPPRFRGSMRASADAMELLQRSMKRALARRGSFSTLSEAAAFAKDALERAKNRLEIPTALSETVSLDHLALDVRRHGATTSASNR